VGDDSKRQQHARGLACQQPARLPADRQEIQSETDRVSGANKNVSDKPIRLKICSPNVL
jgi:hypothetical protein